MHLHDPGSGGSAFASGVIFVGASLLLAGYVGAAMVSGRRGRSWPWWRTALWCAGIAVAAASVLGAFWPGGSTFRDHVWAHLLAMAAPILIVSAAPLTLALRSLHVSRARRLSRMLRSAPIALIAHPVSAGIITAGGLWLLYATPVLSFVHASPTLLAGAHLHLIAAGCLFTAAVIGPDPRPHPAPRSLVAAVIVAASAAHGILMKYLYAHPTAGMDPGDVRAGAESMYYAGAYVEAVVIVVFCLQWYRAAGRERTRPRPRLSPQLR